MPKQDRRPMVVLFIILFLVMVGFGLVIPTMPFYITKMGGGSTSFGLFMTLYSLMQFFFAPFWGRLSDRIGRRPVIMIGLSGYATTFIMFGFATELWMLFVIRALSGMVSSATLPTAMAYMADITKGSDRSKSMGMVGAAMGLGMICGPIIGGLLGAKSFAIPFFLAGGLALLVIPFAYAFLPETLKEQTSPQEQTKRFSRAILEDPLFFLFVLTFVVNFSMALFEGTFALLVRDRLGFGTKEMGNMFAVLGVIGVIVQGGLNWQIG